MLFFFQPRDLEADTKSVQSYEEAPAQIQPVSVSPQNQEVPVQSSSPLPTTETPPTSVTAGGAAQEDQVDEYGYSMGELVIG